MTEKMFTDSVGDTLKVTNYGPGGKTGALTVREGTRNGQVFELDGKNRLPIATEILMPLDAVVIEGPLPDVRVTEYAGKKYVNVGNFQGEATESERDYYLTQARRNLSMAGAITRILDKDEVERQARLAGLAKLNKRRNELAAQFSNLPNIEYRDISSTALKRAIDRVVEMEDAK